MQPDTMKLQFHEIAFKKLHAFIRVVPNDQNRWKNDPRFMRGADGRYFVTFGAGPTGCGLGLCLVSANNRPLDAAPHSGEIILILDLKGRDENAVIELLFRLDSRYADRRPYTLYPLVSGENNSNSFASGLLRAANLPVPDLSSTNPGWSHPLPQSDFR